ncbi:MAG: ABC transporter permease [Psychromonas sp.]
MLTASALALALVLSLLMRSIQEGSFSTNIENIARLSTGLIQLQHPQFKDSQSIDDLLPQSLSFIEYAQQHPYIATVLPRIESFALAAATDKSKGVMISGIDPQKEEVYSHLSEKLIAGNYFSADTIIPLHQQILIAEGLAAQLGVTLGDEVVLYGQGYRGQTAAGLYLVHGILYFPMKELNNQLLYMPLQSAQQLYSTGGLVTSWVLHTKKFKQVEQVTADLQLFYAKDVSVRNWQDLSPDLAQQIFMDRNSGLFLMYLLYGIVGFALFSTLLMMTLERQREFAVMLATGLLRSKLIILISIESSIIGLFGICLGLVIVLPILIWLFFNPITLSGETAQMMLDMGYKPIIPVLLDPLLFIHQVMIVLVLLVFCLIYPMWRLYKMDLVSALKGGAHAN